VQPTRRTDEQWAEGRALTDGGGDDGILRQRFPIRKMGGEDAVGEARQQMVEPTFTSTDHLIPPPPSPPPPSPLYHLVSPPQPQA
jgi:hypothetical protein